jgi:hypothetical protein
MKPGRVFIKLKTGRNGVESLFTFHALGHFCGHILTLLTAVPELTSR